MVLKLFMLTGADVAVFGQKDWQQQAILRRMDIHGIGFVTADAAAAKLGFEHDNPLRIQAGTLYVLQKSTDDGNVYLPQAELTEAVCAQLGVDEALVEDALAALESDERIVREEQDMTGPAGPT